MNWRRGLIRLWIVLSILWVVGTGWVLDPLQQIRDATGPVIFRIGDAVIEFPRETPLPTIKKALTDFAHTEVEKKPTSPELFLEGAEAAVARALSGFKPQPLWRSLYPTVGLLVLPPLFVLTVVFLALWIVRGFRDHPQAPSI